MNDKEIILFNNLNDNHINKIDLSFENIDFIDRLNIKFLFAFTFGITLFGIIFNVMTRRIDNNYATTFIIIFLFYFIFFLISEGIEKRYYIIKLVADSRTIEIEFLDYDMPKRFSANIEDVEFKRKRTKFSKVPRTILTIKKEKKKILSLYAFTHKELPNKTMELLIIKLNQYKANRQHTVQITGGDDTDA